MLFLSREWIEEVEELRGGRWRGGIARVFFMLRLLKKGSVCGCGCGCESGN